MDHYPIYWPLALIVFNFCLYGRTLRYGLVIDDIEWYEKIRQGIFQRAPFTRLYSHYGLPHPIEHSITLTLHIITVLLISQISPLTALLYSCHPCNHQTAIWLNGRRYSYLNIIVLSCWLLHLWWLLIPVSIAFISFARKQLSMRSDLTQPQFSPFQTIFVCTAKLLGFYRFSFIYPDGPAPFLPQTQPVAERYLSIPLILVCIGLSHMPIILICPLFALYALQTHYLIPMYRSIKSFYDHHALMYPGLAKLYLLKSLYPQIETEFVE